MKNSDNKFSVGVESEMLILYGIRIVGVSGIINILKSWLLLVVELKFLWGDILDN